MALNKITVLFINYLLVIFVSGQELVEKDVEIISGKNNPRNPLDAQFIGHYANEIYGPPVSFKMQILCVAMQMFSFWVIFTEWKMKRNFFLLLPQTSIL